jgi:type IV pilus assembly protein PilC
MAKYNYTAFEAGSGKETKGTIESTSAEQASAELKSRGLRPTGLSEAGAAPAKPAKKDPARTAPAVAAKGGPAKKKAPIVIGRVVSLANLTVFTRQLSTLVNAGMPIMRSLETLARQEKNIGFKMVIESLADTIRSGGNFSDGLLQHPKIFDRLYVNMVKAGEAGGVLGTVLDRLSKFMEKAERIKGKVKSAMTYPVIIAGVAVAIVGALMVFVIPKFQGIFKTMLKGEPLPQLTQYVLNVSNFIVTNIWATLGIMVLIYFLFLGFKRTKFGTSVIDWILIKFPALGPLFLKASIGRFTRTLGTLLSSGVPILQAIIITRDTSGNVHVANALSIVHDRVKEGDNVAKPLDSTKVFPNMVSSMIEVGEETGALPDMLNRIADTYDEEVDNAVAGLTSIIEPIMIVFMAVIVGTIVIALFLPIIKIIQKLQG